MSLHVGRWSGSRLGQRSALLSRGDSRYYRTPIAQRDAAGRSSAPQQVLEPFRALAKPPPRLLQYPPKAVYSRYQTPCRRCRRLESRSPAPSRRTTRPTGAWSASSLLAHTRGATDDDVRRSAPQSSWVSSFGAPAGSTHAPSTQMRSPLHWVSYLHPPESTAGAGGAAGGSATATFSGSDASS